jgi:hypothetical protein
VPTVYYGRLTMKKVKALCSGCKNDYYNHNREGGCWDFKTAEVVNRTKVGIWQNPPYKWNPETTLSCHNPKGSVWIDKNDVRIK